ncbi:MAG: hypothetical protein WC756_12190 [Taibaiella sp.]|jgi:hypothetical protein
MDFLKRIWGRIVKQFTSSQALIFIIVGLAVLFIAEFTVDNEKIREICVKIGLTMFGSGIFAVILKSMQFMGVFKDELQKIIYEDKYLSNRKDLHEFWEQVSKVLFKNKFPRISKDIMADVKKIYFPTDHVLYYDNYTQDLEIEIIDADEDIIKVVQHSTYTVFPTDINVPVDHITKNYMYYANQPDETTFTVTSYKINGVPCEYKSEALNEDNKKRILNVVSVVLQGQSEYKFETTIEKTYSLKHDHIISVAKDYLIHDFCLKIYKDANIKVTFFKLGTLNEFKHKKIQNGNVIEYGYKGIIYPKQGYVLFLEKLI